MATSVDLLSEISLLCRLGKQLEQKRRPLSTLQAALKIPSTSTNHLPRASVAKLARCACRRHLVTPIPTHRQDVTASRMTVRESVFKDPKSVDTAIRSLAGSHKEQAADGRPSTLFIDPDSPVLAGQIPRDRTIRFEDESDDAGTGVGDLPTPARGLRDQSGRMSPGKPHSVVVSAPCNRAPWELLINAVSSSCSATD